MAVVSVAFDGTRLSEAESETDGGTWDEFGTTKSPTQETAIVYQEGTSSAAISLKVSATTNGVDFDSTATHDFATGPKNVLAQVNVTEVLSIDTTVHAGTEYVVGSSGSDYYSYYIHGSKKPYPPLGGWQILCIDPNEAGYRANTTGTPALGSVDYFGWQADMTGTAKAENVIHDSLSYLTTGDGITLTRGDSTDPDGTFQDMADYDAGTVANRWGVITQNPPDTGPLNVNGWLNIGDSAGTNPTVFDDSGVAIFYPEQLTAEGFQGLKVYQGNAADSFAATNCSFNGLGRGFPKDFFGTTADVDGTNNVVTLDTDKNWQDLDYVLYSKEGGTVNMGLTDATNYWIAWDSTNSGWAFYSSRDNAATDTSRVSLTSTGAENHSLLKEPDTRPDLTVSGTTGLGATFTTCTIANHRNVTLTSVTTMDTCAIECESLVQGSADIDGCTIRTTSETSVATLQDPTFGTTTDLINTTFVQGGSGHAIEIDTAGSYTFTNLFFSGYGADTTDSAALDITETTGTVTITIDGGDTPTYKTAGATVVINADTSITLTGLIAGTEVRVYKTSDDSVVDGVESSGTTFNFSVAAATNIYIRIFNTQYLPADIENYVVPATNTSIPVQQIFDRNYSNP
jgi:hypothetical protein